MRLFEITGTPDDYLLGSRIEKIIDELCGLSMTLPLSAPHQSPPSMVQGGRPVPDFLPDLCPT
jgi:hypothetical protein